MRRQLRFEEIIPVIPDMRRVARRMCAPDESFEDLVNEAIAEAARRTVDEAYLENPLSVMCGIMKNILYRWRRSAKSRGETSAKEDEIPVSRFSPQKLYEGREDDAEYARYCAAVREAIVNDPIVLGIFDGAEDREPESVEESAERLGVLTKEIIRARERLKYAMEVVAEKLRAAGALS